MLRKSGLLASLMFAFLACSSITQAQTPSKRDLIIEFRKLTGATTINGSLNFSSDGVRQMLSNIVSSDKELSDTQKQSLREDVEKATSRIERRVREFINNQTEMAKLSEEVIFHVYDTSFTEAELTEAIAFYRTPTGQKIAAF